MSDVYYSVKPEHVSAVSCIRRFEGMHPHSEFTVYLASGERLVFSIADERAAKQWHFDIKQKAGLACP